MKYSYEYKRKCVEMYREGEWPETPEGIQDRNFHEIVRKWFWIEESCGPDALRHKLQSKISKSPIRTPVPQKRPLIVEKWLSVSVGKCKSALENRELIAYNKRVTMKKF